MKLTKTEYNRNYMKQYRSENREAYNTYHRESQYIRYHEDDEYKAKVLNSTKISRSKNRDTYNAYMRKYLKDRRDAKKLLKGSDDTETGSSR